MIRYEIGDAGLGDVPGIAFSGDLDMNAADALDEALDTHIRTTTGAFIVDLMNADFLDSSGLAILLRARGQLGTEDRALVILCERDAVWRTFEITGTDELFVIYHSPEEALAALVPAD